MTLEGTLVKCLKIIAGEEVVVMWLGNIREPIELHKKFKYVEF